LSSASSSILSRKERVTVDCSIHCGFSCSIRFRSSLAQTKRSSLSGSM
jgi:hypothetical protein